MTRTRIGMIGAGFIADRHVGKLSSMDDVQIVAVSDPDGDRARHQASRCDAKPYQDFRQMLDSEYLDALYVCLPPFAHGDPERAALERGLPFFVEKPLATTYEAAEALSREIEAKALLTAVGYHWRYLDTVERAQELLAARPARLALGLLDRTPRPRPPGWSKEDGSGGQMVEQTTHIFDLARLLVGDVTQVYATGSRLGRADFPNLDVLDVSVATLNFATGAVGTMASSCLLNWPPPDRPAPLQRGPGHRIVRVRADDGHRPGPPHPARPGRPILARGSRVHRRRAGQREPHPFILRRGDEDPPHHDRRRPLRPRRDRAAALAACENVAPPCRGRACPYPLYLSPSALPNPRRRRG